MGAIVHLLLFHGGMRALAIGTADSSRKTLVRIWLMLTDRLLALLRAGSVKGRDEYVSIS